MSNVQDIITALAEGENAKRQVPELLERLSHANRIVDSVSEHNAQLELRAKEREDKIGNLRSSLNQALTERDDALMQVMEVEEKLKSFRKLVQGFSDTLDKTVRGIDDAVTSLDPPKPVEPTPTPMTEPAGPTVQADPAPVTETAPATNAPITESGQSAADPTASSMALQSQNAGSATVGTDASTSTEPQLAPKPWWEPNNDPRF